jgi:hypothetical protein
MCPTSCLLGVSPPDIGVLILCPVFGHFPVCFESGTDLAAEYVVTVESQEKVLKIEDYIKIASQAPLLQ